MNARLMFWITAACVLFASRGSFGGDSSGGKESALPEVIGDVSTALVAVHWESERPAPGEREFIHAVAKDLPLTEFTWRFIGTPAFPDRSVDKSERDLLKRVPKTKPKDAKAVFAQRETPDRKQTISYVPVYARESCVKCHTQLGANGNQFAAGDLMSIAVISIPASLTDSTAPKPKTPAERGQGK